MLKNFSKIYERINETWFGSWPWSLKTYGNSEIRTDINHYGTIEVAEFVTGTSIKHGRVVTISTYGGILDRFYN